MAKEIKWAIISCFIFFYAHYYYTNCIFHGYYRLNGKKYVHEVKFLKLIIFKTNMIPKGPLLHVSGFFHAHYYYTKCIFYGHYKLNRKK